LRRSRRKPGWAAARALPKCGWPSSSPGASCSRWRASARKSLARPCAWRAISCPCHGKLLRGSPRRVVWPVKAEQFRDMSPEELQRKLDDLKEELFNLRFQVATGQLDNPMRMRQVRKDIARALTVMRERELGLAR